MELQKEVAVALQNAVETKFWGDIRLTWQAGEVITIRTESNQKIKPNIRPTKENTREQQSTPANRW
jgi:hypothetical protein